MFRLTRITWKPLKHFLIKSFICLYKVDMSIAEQTDPRHYRHFNDFFTRKLKPGSRPIDPTENTIVSPVDGVISQAGTIDANKLIQAKGKEYTLQSLLGGNPEMSGYFIHGRFITLYLSPRDYHRIHMPLTGTLKSMAYVPGRLFSVSPATTLTIDNLFARNERVIQIFETEIGKMALVMVGAIFVGSMETVWAGQITPASQRQPWVRHYPKPENQITLSRGEEMGRFNMGSTVIVLFEDNRLHWDETTKPGQSISLGQRIAGISQS